MVYVYFKKWISDLKKRYFLYMEKRKIYDLHKEYSKIHPLPFSARKANIVLVKVPPGNIWNLGNLIELFEHAKETQDYSSISSILDQYFINRDDVHYRDYFLDVRDDCNVLINPEERWKKVIDGYRDIKLNILELRKTAIQHPDNYYYIKQLDRLCSVLESFMVKVKEIEYKQH